MGSRDTQSFLSNPSAIQVEVRCDAHPIVCAPLDYTSQELLLIGNKAQLPVLLVEVECRVQEPFLNMGSKSCSSAS